MNIEKFYDDLNIHFDRIRANTIGLDKVLDNIHNQTLNSMRMTNQSSYPPYNIRKIDSTTIEDEDVQEQFVIELALAGFKKEELNIEQKENVLFVSGRANSEDKDDAFVVRKIGLRQFKREFLLSENAEVSRCDYIDGMLSITIDVVVPEEEQPKRIDIK